MLCVLATLPAVSLCVLNLCLHMCAYKCGNMLFVCVNAEAYCQCVCVSPSCPDPLNLCLCMSPGSVYAVAFIVF